MRMNDREIEIYVAAILDGKSKTAARRAVIKARKPPQPPTEAQIRQRQQAAKALKLSQAKGITLAEAWEELRK